MAHTGYVSGTLAVREGLRAPVPALDPRAILTMADMGHGAQGGMGHDGMPGMDHAAMGHDMSGMQHDGTMQSHPASEEGNPFVDMQATSPTPRLDDPGIGLRDNGRHVLSYSMLKSTFEDPDGRDPAARSNCT